MAINVERVDNGSQYSRLIMPEAMDLIETITFQSIKSLTTALWTSEMLVFNLLR